MEDAPRFLFVDRVRAHEPGKWVRAEHVVSPAHAQRPGPFRLLEALAQAAGWLIAASTGFTKRGLPISIASVRLLGPVPVAATILLEAEIVAWREESALARARASVDGAPLVEIERGICALIPADRLDDPENTRAMFSCLTADAQGDGQPPGARPDGWPPTPTLDGIASLTVDGRTRASWKISPAERYFLDHFPRLPVVPGALQAQALVELAGSLFASGQRRPAVERFTEAKFRGFVRPGDELVLEAETVSKAADRAVATAQGLLRDKRVVSLQEIHFRLDARDPGP